MDTFHAIADPNRRRLLDLLREREQSVQQLVPHLGITVGGVSQHLKILRESGLVKRRKQGRFCYYRAEPLALRDIDDWIEQYRHFWSGRLKRLGRYLDRST